MTRARLALIGALSLLAAVAPARAQADPARGGTAGPTSLSLWGVVDPGPVDGVGVGARVALPIAPQGVLHARVRDELVLEVGGDFVHYSDRVGLPPTYVDYTWDGVLLVGGVAWNFWFAPQLALYPKIDLGYTFGTYHGWNPAYGYSRAELDGLFVQGAVGLIYRLTRLDLRVELGSGLLRAGVGIPF